MFGLIDGQVLWGGAAWRLSECHAQPGLRFSGREAEYQGGRQARRGLPPFGDPAEIDLSPETPSRMGIIRFEGEGR